MTTMNSAHPSAAPVLAILEDLPGFHETPMGSNHFMACCPAHDDHTPSLSIGMDDDGRVLVHCFAGCDRDAIRDALGASWRDYFPMGVAPGEKRYPVKDYNGKTRGTQRRIFLEDGKKITPWINHDTGSKGMPLYGADRLRDLPSGAQVILCEGPRGPEALWKRGVMAVGTMTGASAIPDDDALRDLRKFNVTPWPDNDDGGRLHMQKNAARLKHLGTTIVGVIHDPHAPPKGDAVDYFAHGGTVDGLAALITTKYEKDEINEKRSTHDTDADLNSLNSSNSYPTLHADALYGLAGDVVRLIAPETEADPVAILAQFLTMAGNLFGRHAYYLAEADRHDPRLFVVLVGASSRGRKGTSYGRALQPLRGVADDWIANNIAGGLSSGEGLIHVLRDEEGNAGKDKRLLVKEGEFASVLNVLTRDGNTISAVIRQMFDGETLRTLTKNSPEQASGTHVSIIGHITQEELIRHLTVTEAADGFGNRFLWVCVQRSQRLPFGGNLQDGDFTALRERLRVVLAFVEGLTDKRVNFDQEARELWPAAYARLTEGPSGLLGAITSRAEILVLRLALTYALLDQSVTINKVHLHAALAMWDYAYASAAYIFGDTLGDPDADTILSALRASPDGLTRTELSALFGRNKSAADIARALKVLQRQHLATYDKEPTSGKDIERWHVVGTK